MRTGADAGFNRPPPLRLASFAATSLGGLLVGLGSLMNWAAVGAHVPGASGNALEPAGVPGIDLIEGKITLLLGFLLLVGGVLTRAIRVKSVARLLAWGVVAGGVIASGLAVLDVIRKDTAFESGAQTTAHEIASATGLPYPDLLARVQKYIVLDLKLGIYLVIAGGILALIGGLLGLVWAERPGRAADVADAPVPSESSTPLSPPEPGASQLPPD